MKLAEDHAAVASRKPRCKECATKLEQPPTGRRKNFCNQSHQKRYWAREDRRKRKEAELAALRAELAAVQAAQPSRNEWYAPNRVNKPVRRTFPDIALDVAASPESTWVPDNWLGPRHPDPARRNGLDGDWNELAGDGSIWMNAPFDPPEELGQWVQKAAETARRGNTVVALLPERTRTEWWKRWIVGTGAAVFEVPGRLRMEGPHAKGNSAREYMVIVVWVARSRPDEGPWPKEPIRSIRLLIAAGPAEEDLTFAGFIPATSGTQLPESSTNVAAGPEEPRYIFGTSPPPGSTVTLWTAAVQRGWSFRNPSQMP